MVLRGYERKQVDGRLGRLNSERLAGSQRINSLERRVEELHVELQNAQKRAAESEPTYAGLGAPVDRPLKPGESQPAGAGQVTSVTVQDDRHRSDSRVSAWLLIFAWLVPTFRVSWST
jgi:hypothetical protein